MQNGQGEKVVSQEMAVVVDNVENFNNNIQGSL